MKRFLVYLMVIVLTVSLGFGIFYLVRDNEIISISNASLYKDVNDKFNISLTHQHKKSHTKINMTNSNDNVLHKNEDGSFTAIAGGMSRINYRTTNVKFRNIWCDVLVGDGSIEYPYYIYNADQLALIGDTTIADNLYTSDKCYKIVNDINVNERQNPFWKPLNMFNGQLDGNGYTIKGIYIDSELYNANETLKMSTDNVGLFQSIGATGRVYNLKIADYTANTKTGVKYDNFGVIAGTNWGVIERVEVIGASLTVDTNCFGGITGQNISSESGSLVDGTYLRNMARVDRCSISNIELGKLIKNNIASVVGMTGHVGGIIGKNIGGALYYSYVSPSCSIYLGANNIICGGLIGSNTFYNYITKPADLDKTYIGGNIKDSYSAMTFYLGPKGTNLAGASVKVGGVIGEVVDTYAKDYIVKNNILGTYYDISKLKIKESGYVIDKTALKGVGVYKVGGKAINIADTNYFVQSKTTALFTNLVNDFISYKTSIIENHQIKEVEILWNFENENNPFGIWKYQKGVNSDYPFLTYRAIVNSVDEFVEAGDPQVKDDNYTREIIDQIAITLNKDNVEIYIGKTFQLFVTPSNIGVTYVSTDSNIATISANGLITAVGLGKCAINVTTNSGAKAKCIVTVVKNNNYSLSLNSNSAVIYTNNTSSTPSTFQIVPKLLLDGEIINNGSFTYSIDNKNIATISNSGLINAVSAGSARVTVTATIGGVSEVFNQVCNITVINNAVIPDMTVNVLNLTLQVEQTFKLIVSHAPSTVTFVSGNTECLRVSADGVLTAIKVYSSKIPVTIQSGKQSLIVYVTIIEKDIVDEFTSTSVGDIKLNYAQSFEIIAKANSNKKVEFSIYSGSGYILLQGNVVTAKYTAGVAIVKAQISGTEVYKLFTISVIAPTLSLSSYEVTLFVGQTKTIYAYNLPSIETYWSDAEASYDVISIKPYGNSDYSKVYVDITGVAAGKDIVKVRCGDQSVYATVIVKAKEVANVNEIKEINPTSKTISTGEFFKIYTTYVSSNMYGLSYSVLNGSTIVTVDSTGKVTAGNVAGSAVVRVSIKNTQVYKDCYVEVIKTASNVYEIYTATQLKNISNHLDGNWILCCDIDLGNEEWTPINDFHGSLQSKKGAIYTIRNFKVTIKQNNNSAGLFGVIYDANLLNFNIENAVIKNNGITGAIVGRQYGSGSIYNVSVKNSIIYGDRVGGAIGYTTSSGTNNKINVYETMVYLMSQNIKSTPSIINCAGGIVGVNQSTLINSKADNVQIITINVFKNVEVALGGIVGSAYFADIKNCTVYKGNVNACYVCSPYVGGIAGRVFGTSKIYNCLVNDTYIAAKGISTVYENGYAGGIAGYVGTSPSSKKATSMDKLAAINLCQVYNSDIIGYYAGGLVGALNSTQKMSVIWNNVVNNYAHADNQLKKNETSYLLDIVYCAVESNCNVTGFNAGGFAGSITNGVISDSYTKVLIDGISQTSTKAGFTPNLACSLVGKLGGRDIYAGIIERSYSLCTFTKSNGTNYSLNKGATFQISDNRTTGFIIDCLYNDDLDGDAIHPNDGKLFSSVNKFVSAYTNKSMINSWNYVEMKWGYIAWNGLDGVGVAGSGVSKWIIKANSYPSIDGLKF